MGNVHLVCPHHKLLDLISSWDAPNLSTLQGMGPVHASKVRTGPIVKGGGGRRGGVVVATLALTLA